MNPEIVFRSHCQCIGHCKCRWTCATIRDEIKEDCESRCEYAENDEHDEECMIEALEIYENHHPLNESGRCMCETCWAVERYIIQLFRDYGKYPDASNEKLNK